MRNRALFRILVAVALATALALALRALRQPAREDSTQTPLIDQSPAPSDALPTPSPPVAQALEKADLEKEFSRLRAKYGNELAIEALPSGHLASIRGRLGHGARAGGAFDASKRVGAVARASEILEASTAALGLGPSLPLSEPDYRGDSISAHIAFKQTFGGKPIEPVGNISVDLGTAGELVGLYSTALTGLRVTNETKMGLEEAKARAAAAVQDETSSQEPAGGAEVIWVSTPSIDGGPSEGRHAYEFSVKGRQVVVDAEDGKILHQRDRRHF